MGWQFTVVVPSWTQTILQNNELVVFYRVEVRVQSSEIAEVAKSRSVLRRFSHFIKLHDKLKEELGAKTLAGLEPPAKRSLFNVNKRPDLIEGRRRDLEQWLWRVVSNPMVARSKVLNKFLELSVAAKLVEQVLQARQAGLQLPAPPEGDDSTSGPDGPGGYAEAGTEFGSEDGTSVWGGDSASVTTDAMSDLRTVSSARSRGLGSTQSTREGSGMGSSSAHLVAPDRAREAAALASSTATAALGREARMRLGLHVEQRTTVKKQVLILQQRLDTVAGDLAGAIAALRHAEARNAELGGRCSDLEARLASDTSAREGELEVQLAQERDRVALLQHQLEEEALQTDLLREQVERLSLQPTPYVPPPEPKPELQQAIAPGGPPDDESHGDSTPDAAALAAALASSQAECAALRAAAAAASEEAEANRAARAGLEEKYKTDLRVLAKEVKLLRKQLSNGQVAAPDDR